MYCTKCGRRLEEGEKNCKVCDGDIIDNVVMGKNRINKKTKILIYIIAAILILGVGGIFGAKYLLNPDSKLAMQIEKIDIESHFKTSKKLNIQVEDINIDKYPTIIMKITKTDKKSNFNNNNITLYEEDNLIEDYDLEEVADGWELKYISNESATEQIEKNIKIENKEDINDIVQADYIKPNQDTVNFVISQVDSNNFPEISLYFNAIDEFGNSLKDFNIDNLNIFTKNQSGEDIKTEIKELEFVDKKEPVSINMVMDTSGSMDGDINKCKEIAGNFINSIDFTMGDRVEVIEFNDISRVNNYFTSNKESLINSINGLRTSGGTALFDSLISALYETNMQEGAKCIIAFTDGDDNMSVNTSTDVINLSQKLSIPIYIIGLGDGLENSILTNITNSTNGEYTNISNIDQLNNIYDKILRKTKEQYVLKYDLLNNDENLLETDVNIGVNSFKYRGEIYHNFGIKPKEYRVDIKKYEKLKEDTKKEAEDKFGNIQGNYSLAFKDMTKGDMLSINSKKEIAASTIKIFIMIEAYDRIYTGRLNENEIITLQDSMKAGGSGILSSKPSGEKISVKELIRLMMVKSDNTAANILIDKLGLDSINQRIKSLGCINTELNRKMMDQDAIDKGVQNYTSVDDLALVLTKLYNGQCVNKQYDSMMIDIMKNNESKSKIPNELPSNVTVANKSGEFDKVENDAGIVFTDKGAYIICVITTEGISGE